jgi:DNA polymerase I-like protein with 3'-5' exonuclease and polymerase domains
MYLQGSVSDALKVVAGNIHEALCGMRRQGYRYRCPQPQQHERRALVYDGGGGDDDDAWLVLSVHDELVFEVREQFLPAFAALTRHCFEKSVILGAPPGSAGTSSSTGGSSSSVSPIGMRARLSAGPTWAQLQPYSQ